MSDGVRADPPGNALRDKVAIALHDAYCGDRSCEPQVMGLYYRQADIALATARDDIAAQAARDERQAIIDLAQERGASYVVGNSWMSAHRVLFADLLRGAETTGDNDEHE